MSTTPGIDSGFVLLDSYYADVLRSLHSYGPMTSAEVADHLGLPVKHVRIYIRRLQLADLVYDRGLVPETGFPTRGVRPLRPAAAGEPPRTLLSIMPPAPSTRGVTQWALGPRPKRASRVPASEAHLKPSPAERCDRWRKRREEWARAIAYRSVFTIASVISL